MRTRYRAPHSRLVSLLLRETQRVSAVGYVPGEHEKVLLALRGGDPKRAAEATRSRVNAGREKALRITR